MPSENAHKMFERYTEKARRSIFFARYEASQFGLQNIDANCLLLGLVRENGQLNWTARPRLVKPSWSKTQEPWSVIALSTLRGVFRPRMASPNQLRLSSRFARSSPDHKSPHFSPPHRQNLKK
jgi:hypothetical protein